MVHVGLFSIRALLQVCGRITQRSERPQTSKERASFAESTPEGEVQQEPRPDRREGNNRSNRSLLIRTLTGEVGG